MDKISNTLIKKTYRTIGNKQTKPYRTYREEIPQAQADLLIQEAIDLIDNKNFLKYFYKTIYIIGPNRFAEAMGYARKEPDILCRSCLFVHKLKQFRTECEITT